MDVHIGRCTAGEIDDVVRFIDEHWKRGHILVTCRPLLEWQYRDADGSGYSFVLARRRTDSQLLGILGYIATRRFDPALRGANVVWLTTWKVRHDAEISGLGIRLLQHLAVTEPHMAIGAVGLTPTTRPIYEAFGYTVGELHHYVSRSRGPAGSAGTLRTQRLRTDRDFASIRWRGRAGSVPLKSSEYFRQRYARHPIYRYAVDALIDSDTTVGLLATRVATHDGSRALRIVDFAGSEDALAELGGHVCSLVAEFDAQYADLYNAGISEHVFAKGGFSKIDPDGPEIVPDHFEPFEHRNVRLWYAIKGAAAVVFKGDGDQDRPNQL